MKTPLVLATVFTAFIGLTGLTHTASAGVDVDIHIGLPPPPHVILRGSDRDNHPRDERNFDRRGGHDWNRQGDYGHRRDHGPRGHWKEVVVKTWVPGRLVVSHDRFGREIRHRERGHYVYRTERVWVNGRRG